VDWRWVDGDGVTSTAARYQRGRYPPRKKGLKPSEKKLHWGGRNHPERSFTREEQATGEEGLCGTHLKLVRIEGLHSYTIIQISN
jgi:hypothetical protein